MREHLLDTAIKLKPPEEGFYREFEGKWEQLAAMGTKALFDREDLDKLIGPGNQQMAADNNRNFPRFMLSLFTNYNPEVFVETVLWVFRAYRSHGFHTTYWAANLNLWVEMLKKELSPGAFGEIYPYYAWLIINIPVFTQLTDADPSSSGAG